MHQYDNNVTLTDNLLLFFYIGSRLFVVVYMVISMVSSMVWLYDILLAILLIYLEPGKALQRVSKVNRKCHNLNEIQIYKGFTFLKKTLVQKYRFSNIYFFSCKVVYTYVFSMFGNLACSLTHYNEKDILKEKSNATLD